MKLSTLIKKLISIQKAEGDLTVARFNWQDQNMPERVSGIETLIVKPHHDAFYVEADLGTGGYAGAAAFSEPYQSEIKARKAIKIVHVF